jgi:hypothetical protein
VRKPRFRLDTLCILVLMAALNLGWYREFVRHGYAYPSVFGFSDRGFDVAVLPMVTALVIGLYYIVFRRGHPSAFLLGFEVCGLVATLAFMVWFWAAPFSVTGTLINGPFPWLVRAFRWGRISSHVFLLACSIIDTSPQLLAALLGGWLAQRMAAHRPTPSSAPSLPHWTSPFSDPMDRRAPTPAAVPRNPRFPAPNRGAPPTTAKAAARTTLQSHTVGRLPPQLPSCQLFFFIKKRIDTNCPPAARGERSNAEIGGARDITHHQGRPWITRAAKISLWPLGLR